MHIVLKDTSIFAKAQLQYIMVWSCKRTSITNGLELEASNSTRINDN